MKGQIMCPCCDEILEIEIIDDEIIARKKS